ncbi:MAG: hypothetical protein DMD59_05680 [Gemmatimonadetes bacterium]|nr:MAG: hypothetical protein DMD59_05680 [Gemmatimonadota bacterium]
MTKAHADQAGVHKREAEQQRPVHQTPAARLRDGGELRGTVAGQDRMHETGAPKQQRADEQAEPVEERTPGHDHGALI